MSGVRAPALVTGLPAIVGDGYLHRASTGSLDRSATSLVAALAERLLFLRAGRNLSSSRYITGTLVDSNLYAVSTTSCFQSLTASQPGEPF